MQFKSRGEGRKRPVQKVLIVCEGEKTEPNYFRGFRVASRVCDIKGTGHNTLSLVQEAKRLATEDNYREVWCVFDRDSFEEKNVRAAFTLARKNNFKIAYSNECFELWYLLHFKFLDTNLRRTEYFTHLKKLLGRYSKNSVNMYSDLLARQSDAMRHAKRLEDTHGLDWCNCTPFTSVHHLVKRLNDLAAKAR